MTLPPIGSEFEVEHEPTRLKSDYAAQVTLYRVTGHWLYRGQEYASVEVINTRKRPVVDTYMTLHDGVFHHSYGGDPPFPTWEDVVP